ncbi:MAG: hypothetical protein HC783_08350 [Rhodobacteraceae bacterium]|nr:hypothetical protein [Paracoccaceae bacterium]
MAVKLVLFGIAAGLAATAGVLAAGGGIGLALVAYICGGMLGMTAGLAGPLLAKDGVAVKMTPDRHHPGINARHPT